MSIHVLSQYRTHSHKLPPFAIAYQPIVNLPARRVVAYEALVRGVDGANYPQMVASMDQETLYSFHRCIAEESIRCAVELGLSERKASLSINLSPDLDPYALTPDELREMAVRHGLPVKRILIELTEDHRLTMPQLREILNRTKAAGFATAMDDFGCGYSGLASLAECRPEILKLDRALVKGIDDNEVKQKIVGAFVKVCQSLRMVLIAEGVETLDECRMLRHLGIRFMQGFFFSGPVLGSLPRFEECTGEQSRSNYGRRKGQMDSAFVVISWNEATPPAKTA